MAIKSVKPVATVVAPKVEKYPVSVLTTEYQGKPVIRVTNNESNYKYDAFSGGATKVRQLFASDADGDAVIATLAKWAVENKAITKEELVAWMERITSQLESVVTDEDDEFKPF